MSDRSIPRDLLLVTVSLCIWGLGEGMFVNFQPIYLKQWGANPVLIGAILSIMGIFMTVAQIPAGWLSDRVGPRPGMWASWILGALATILMAAASSLPFFLVGMFLYGLTSFVIAPMNSYLTKARGSWTIQKALIVPNATYSIGMVVGALVGGQIGGNYGIRAIYAVSAVLFVISTTIVLFCRPAPHDEHHEATAHRPNIFNNPRFGGFLALIFVTMFALYLPQPLTPNFLEGEGRLSFQMIGVLGSIGSLGTAIITYSLARLSAPIGFIAGQVLVALYALFLWQGHGPLWFGLAYFFLGGYRLSRSMTLAYARQFIRASETGIAYGLIETANGATVIFAPFLAGVLFDRSPRLVYGVALTCIVVVIALNFLIQWLIRRKASTADFKQPTQTLMVETREESI